MVENRLCPITEIIYNISCIGAYKTIAILIDDISHSIRVFTYNNIVVAFSYCSKHARRFNRPAALIQIIQHDTYLLLIRYDHIQ